jgi:hypothetical protein
VKCGTTGATCCPGNQCTSGCCVSYYEGGSYDGPTCVATGSVCDTTFYTTGPTCAATGSCQGTGGAAPCGGIGQSCCPSSEYPTLSIYDYCSAPGSHCIYSSTTASYTCTACGDKGQPCCGDYYSNGTSCKSPYACLMTYSGGTYAYTCSSSTATSTTTATATY